MNSIVREMNPIGEIELTDAQLTAVHGAWDDQDDCGENKIIKKHEEFHEKLKVHFEFDFSKEIEKEKDECKKDC